jgi:hypothetical protein
LRAVSWLLSCYPLAVLLLSAAGAQQGNSKRVARKQQGNSRKSASGTQKSAGFVPGKNDRNEEPAGSAVD